MNDDMLNVRVWTSNGMVNIEGMVSDKATVAMYDMMGRKLVDRRLSGSDRNSFAVPSETRGVYLVKVIDGVRVFSGKVVF